MRNLLKMSCLRALGQLPFLIAACGVLCTAALASATGTARLGRIDGLPAEKVQCVLQDRHGFVWVGTQEGLARWDGHRLRHFFHDPGSALSLPSNDVRALFESRSGHLWVGTGAGLARYEREPGTFRPVLAGDEAADVLAFKEDEEGRQWVATQSGLLLADPGRPGWHSIPALEGQAIMALVEDRGGMWIGTHSGVAFVNPEADPASSDLVVPEPLADSLSDVTSLALDRSGALWVGNADGLMILDVVGRRMHSVDTVSQVTSLLASADGSVMWIGTESGLKVLTVGADADFGLDVDAAGPSRLEGRSVGQLARGRIGQVWAATDGGLYGLPPANGGFALKIGAPTVTFSGLQVGGRLLMPEDGSPLPQDLSTLERLFLPAGSRMVTLELAALRFESLDELRYSYRLRGFHEFWQETGADRPQAVYSSLPAGSYVLEARAAVADGPWGEPSRLTLVIEPPRWQGAGASALLLVAIAAAWWGVRRVRQAKAQRESAMAARLREMHEQKLESLATLAGGVAHDFNNLLVGIFGHAELAKISIGGDSPARTHLERILASARRAAELSKQMLFYSGRAQFVVEPVRVGEIVGEEAETLRQTLSASTRLLVETEQNLPAIDADASQLRQVVSNLIVNAAEALGDRDGFIAVGVRLRECDETFLTEQDLAEKLTPGTYVSITVEDTAGGIDEESLGKIFDPFFSTKSPGRGLGLAAAQGIAQGHGGVLRAASVPGRGTTFECLLPAIPANPSGSDHTPASGTPVAVGGGARGQILVVESDREVRSVACEYLDKLGFDTLEAADHATALAVFSRHRYRLALVLLELQPGGQTLETFRELKRLEPSLPVVMTGALSLGEAERHLEHEGPLTYLEKPLRLAHLQKVVRENVAGGSIH